MMNKVTIEKLISLGFEYGQCNFEYIYKLLPDSIELNGRKLWLVITNEESMIGYKFHGLWLFEENIEDSNISESSAQLFITLKEKNFI